MSIGLLFGSSPWDLRENPERPGPILRAADVTDCTAAFVADPFAVEHDGRWHLFFEVMNRDSGKGDIAYAWSDDLMVWTYDRIVLAEPFHLSYPAIYRDGGEFWMIPETWESGEVRLYRATSFPYGWELVSVLLNSAGTDPTLRRTEHGWAMLLCGAEGVHNESLREFEAPTLAGPWREAAGSPLVQADSSMARPGGHCFAYEGVDYRLAQDCSTRYGESLNAFPLGSTAAQHHQVLVPQGNTWRARGGHHADFHSAPEGEGWMAFVDGEA
jgi:hypothetical protein